MPLLYLLIANAYAVSAQALPHFVHLVTQLRGPAKIGAILRSLRLYRLQAVHGLLPEELLDIVCCHDGHITIVIVGYRLLAAEYCATDKETAESGRAQLEEGHDLQGLKGNFCHSVIRVLTTSDLVAFAEEKSEAHLDGDWNDDAASDSRVGYQHPVIL